MCRETRFYSIYVYKKCKTNASQKERKYSKKMEKREKKCVNVYRPVNKLQQDEKREILKILEKNH